MARTSTLSALDARVLRRIPRLWLPMALVGALGLLLLHQRDRDRDRVLAWERGAGVVRLQSGALEAELDGLVSFTAQLARGDDIGRILEQGAAGDAERSALAELLRLHEELFELEVRDTADTPLLAVVREGAPPLPAPQEPVGTPAADEVVLAPLRTFAGPAGPRALVRAAALVRGAEGRARGSFVSVRDATALVARLRRASSPASWCTLVDGRGGYVVGPPEGVLPTGDVPGAGAQRSGSPSATRIPHDGVRDSVCSGDRGQLLVEEGLYTWVRVGRERPWSWRESAPSIVSFVPAATIYAESSRTLRRLLLFAAGVGLLLLALAWRLAWADVLRVQHLEGLAASQERLQRLSQRLLDVQEEERRSISRDLHDELGQLATAMTIDLKRAERSEDDAQRAQLIARARTSAERTLASVRDLAARLRTSVLDDLGLPDALETLCDELRVQGLDVRLACRLQAGEPAPGTRSCVYRLVQEALTNVARHARARSVDVDVRSEEASVHVRIRDDGHGFDVGAVPAGHLGLIGMRERVELAGGTFRLASAPGRGTLITAVVPLHDAAPRSAP